MTSRRRAPNAFMIYRSETLPLLAQQRTREGYSLSSNELSAQVADMWNNETEAVRRRCFAKSRKLQQQMEMVTLQQLGNASSSAHSYPPPSSGSSSSYNSSYFDQQQQRRVMASTTDSSHLHIQAKLPLHYKVPTLVRIESNQDSQMSYATSPTVALEYQTGIGGVLGDHLPSDHQLVSHADHHAAIVKREHPAQPAVVHTQHTLSSSPRDMGWKVQNSGSHIQQRGYGQEYQPVGTNQSASLPALLSVSPHSAVTWTEQLHRVQPHQTSYLPQPNYQQQPVLQLPPITSLLTILKEKEDAEFERRRSLQ
ncbi:hypothetical protein BDR26DRAFT_872561 [Obelidium mucronatum]|nr:hypothetical protein BDR26DRAFT_872561 [Obelidium mucronatum]